MMNDDRFLKWLSHVTESRICPYTALAVTISTRQVSERFPTTLLPYQSRSQTAAVPLFQPKKSVPLNYLPYSLLHLTTSQTTDS